MPNQLEQYMPFLREVAKVAQSPGAYRVAGYDAVIIVTVDQYAVDKVAIDFSSPRHPKTDYGARPPPPKRKSWNP